MGHCQRGYHASHSPLVRLGESSYRSHRRRHAGGALAAAGTGQAQADADLVRLTLILHDLPEPRIHSGLAACPAGRPQSKIATAIISLGATQGL